MNTFTSVIKTSSKGKYLEMLEKKTIKHNRDIHITSTETFMNNYSAAVARLDKEAERINTTIDNIKLETKYREAIKIFNAGEYESARVQFEKLGNYKDSVDWNAKCQIKINESEHHKAATISALKKAESIAQIIVFLLPLVFDIIYAVILFSNVGKISSFGGWCFGWIIFTIGALSSAILLLKTRITEWKSTDIKARISAAIVAVLLIVSMIVVFPNSSKLKSGYNTDSSNYTTSSSDSYSGDASSQNAGGTSNGSSTNSSTKESEYQQAISLYNKAEYTKASAKFQALGNYKDSEEYYELCESKKPHEELEKALYRIAGSDAVLPDYYELAIDGYETEQVWIDAQWATAFKCYLAIPYGHSWYEYTSIIDQKVRYEEGYSYLYNNLYRKKRTYISISEPIDDENGYYVEYKVYTVK